MANRDIFSRLKRLFSTDVVIRNVGGNQLKVLDSNSIQAITSLRTNKLVDRYSRLYKSAAGTPGSHIPGLNYQTMRYQLYTDYEAMDTDAIISSALDIVADECTLKDDMGEVLSIKSTSEDVQEILYNLFYDVLNIEFNLWMWARQMCKYGDFFLKLDIQEKFGVFNVEPYTAYHVTRREGTNPENPMEIDFEFHPDGLSGQNSFGGHYGAESNGNTNRIIWDNYEIAHFRLLTDANYLPYGRSYIEPGRKLFKQYTLMEDAMLVHRIVRAPEKRVYYINVGSIPPAEVDAFMEQTISKMKRTPYIDPETGDYNLKFNMQNMMEDFYLPVRGGDATTKIDTTPGLSYDGIQDVEYLRDKLFAALKIPKAFLGYDDNVEGKATLAAEDIRFARTIDRIQRILLSELYKIATVHLYAQGYQAEDLTNFELSLTTPSIIYDQERIALMKEKVELSNDMIENNLLPRAWVMENIWRFSENESEEYNAQILADAEVKFRLNQIQNEGNDPKETGKSYGTPHDLASLGGLSTQDPALVPDGYGNDADLGRPKEKSSKTNTQDSAFGKDRLGKKGMKNDDNESDSIRPKFKGAGPLALERLLKKVPTKKKRLIFEKDETKGSMLDEDNIKEQKS